MLEEAGAVRFPTFEIAQEQMLRAAGVSTSGTTTDHQPQTIEADDHAETSQFQQPLRVSAVESAADGERTSRHPVATGLG